MNPTFFDDLGNQGASDTNKPFFDVNRDNDNDLLEWLTRTLTTLQSNSWARLERVKNNYFRYKGIQYMQQVYQPRDIPETRKRYMPQIVVPLIRDGIDEKVSRILETKPTVTVIPKDDEERDKVDAKIAKRFLSHVERHEKMQAKYRAWLKNAEIAGESYLLPRWNPDKGEIVPESQMLEETTANDQKTTKLLRVGDVEIVQFTPHFAFPEEAPSRKWEDVNWIFLIEYEYTEGLKRDYPAKAGDIYPEPYGSVYFDFEHLEDRNLAGFTKKITFYHKATKYLPHGYEVCFVKNAILKKGDLPPWYEGQLPPERLIVSKNEEELHGESSIEPVRGIAAQVSNAQNLVIKQLMLTAHPKWFVEEGSVNDQSLGNDTTIVKMKKGAQKPVLAQANPISPQLIENIKDMKNDFYTFFKSNSVVRGEPPPGVTAFVALQYLSESESRRLSTEVSYFSEGVVNLNDKILKVAAYNYKPEDNRTMMIVGKDNRFSMMRYNPESLKKNFSVILQNSSSLPDSRSGRVQALMETEERFPGMLPREQVVEMLGFAQSEKFADIAGAAARAAEEENEHILDGNGMIEPAAHEDLIVHWLVHSSGIQDVGFKTRVAPEIQQQMLDHLLGTEMLMMERISVSPPFAQQVAVRCPQFPMLMIPPAPPPPVPVGIEEEMMAQQAAPPPGQEFSGQPPEQPLV